MVSMPWARAVGARTASRSPLARFPARASAPPHPFPRPPSPRIPPLRCHFLLQSLRFETEIGISRACGCGCGRGDGRGRGWRAGAGCARLGRAGGDRPDQGRRRGVTLAHIATHEQVDAVVVLDHQHSIRLGPRRKYRGSHGHARDKPFTASDVASVLHLSPSSTAPGGAQLLTERMRQFLFEASDFPSIDP